MVEFISKWSLCLACYVLLLGISSGQDLDSILDLDKVADLLKFPRSELVITNYLDQEKFIYTKKTLSEDQRGQFPPVDPTSIYQSYWIASKTPNAFLPIIVTLSKRDAYLTPKVKEIIKALSAHAVAQRSKGVYYPYGNFELQGASRAAMFWEEIRVPAFLKKTIESGDNWTRQDEYPKFRPANVSITTDALSEVDVRITQYACLYFSDKLVKLPGGENYFAAFNEDPEDDPKGYAVFDFLKGLNQIVLTSPMMNPYRKTLGPPILVPQPPEKEVDKPEENSFAPPDSPAPPPQPKNLDPSVSKAEILGMILLALGLFAVLFLKLRKKRF